MNNNKVILLLIILTSCNTAKKYYNGCIGLDKTKVIASKPIDQITIYEYERDSVFADFGSRKLTSLKHSRKFTDQNNYSFALGEYLYYNNRRISHDTIEIIKNILDSIPDMKIPKKINLDTTCTLKFYQIFEDRDCFSISYDCFQHNSYTLNEIMRPDKVYRVIFHIPDAPPSHGSSLSKTVKEEVVIHVNNDRRISRSYYKYTTRFLLTKKSQVDRL